MAKRAFRQKRSLSLHQKQMRFLTGLSLVVGILIVIAVFWLVNRPGFVFH